MAIGRGTKRRGNNASWARKRASSARTRRLTKARPARRRTATVYRKRKSAARAPLVECKHKEIEPPTVPVFMSDMTERGPYSIIPIDQDNGGDASKKSYIHIPATWNKMTRGLNDDQMVGKDLFAKWLHVKVRVSFNHSTSLFGRMRLRVMHGWVMLPGCVPDGGENTNFLGDATKILKEEFGKILAGPDKTKVRLLSDRWLTRSPITGIDAVASVKTSRLPMDYHFKWSPMRKIRYDQEDVDVSGRFFPSPNEGLWIPFWCIWDQSSQQAASGYIPGTVGPQQQVREDFYYTDS